MPNAQHSSRHSMQRLATLRPYDWRWLTFFATLLVVSLLLQPWRSPLAMAAEAGPGYSRDGSAAAFVGAMRFDNANAYCLELDQPSPIGHTTRLAHAGDNLPSDIAAMDERTRARLHWVVSVRGSSQDPALTAAVAMYVWSVADAEHYRGDDHYLSLLPTDIRNQVATNLAEVRGTAADVRPVTIPQDVHLQLDTGPGHATLTVGDIPVGSEVVLRVSGGTIHGERELTVSADSAKTLRVRPDSQTTELAVDAQARAASRYATADPRFLITEGHQLLVQAAPESWPTARTSVSLRPGIRNVPRTPPLPPAPVTPDVPATPSTPTTTVTPPVPKSTAPQSPAPESPAPESPAPEPSASKPPAPNSPTPEAPTPEAPTPEAPAPEAPAPEPPSNPVTPATPAPPVTEESDPTPTNESAAEPDPTQTPPSTTTTTPTPTATYSYATDDPDTPASKIDSGASPTTGAPLASSQSPGKLAETGAGGNMLFIVGGVGLTAIGAGGWLIARRQARPLASDAVDPASGGW